jgi:hypothetical protein
MSAFAWTSGGGVGASSFDPNVEQAGTARTNTAA